MSLMDWDSERFDILVPDMNAQHQKLVSIMNHLYERHDAGAGKSELDNIMIELRNYTLKHFQDEEAYFDSIGFPEAAKHKLVHKKLIEDFVRHYEEFAAGPGTISKQFFNFLKLWLTSHIMHIDRKYGDYSQHQGAA